MWYMRIYLPDRTCFALSNYDTHLQSPLMPMSFFPSTALIWHIIAPNPNYFTLNVIEDDKLYHDKSGSRMQWKVGPS